jgi:hypothetical protein
LAVVFASVLVVAPIFAQGAIQYTAQLSSQTPTYNVSFSFTNTDTTATIYLDLAQGSAFTNLQVTVGVGPGATVSYQITDPNGISQGTSAASGAPSSIAAQNPVSGQWTLSIASTGAIASGQSVPVTVTATATPPSTTSSLDLLLELGSVVAVVVVIIGVILYLRKGRESNMPVGAPTPMGAPLSPASARSSETQVIQKGTMQYYASLELPDGQTIPMTQLSQDFGRTDFETRVPKEVSNIISRRQFQISFNTRDKKFYIEDLGSTNGTMVNASDIRGKGKVPLNSGDVINPADVISLKFKG